MRGGSVHIIGGGPGGLYLALLLRRRSADWDVVVHETTPPGQTFGFGVGFTESTLRRLADAEADSHAEILRHACSNPVAQFEVESGSAPIDFRGNVAIARADLLALLTEQASAAGAQLRVGGSARADQFDAGEIVVAADGAGSATRQSLRVALGEHVATGRGLYLWCGADMALPRSIFATATAGPGVFVAHAYPYAPDRSTFLIETDTGSWEATGLAAEAATVAPGESDERSLATLQRAFADTLGDARLIGNGSQWRRFRTVTLERWHDGNVALLGDAAHTAHYSVGSGTKMAMEDAIVLATALVQEDDMPRAFARYERERRPAVNRLQRLAHRSQEWWESFPSRRRLPAAQLALAFLTRNGNLGLADIRAEDPSVARAAARTVGSADDSPEALLCAPLRHGDRSFAGRVLEGPASYREVETVEQAREAARGPANELVGAAVRVDGLSAWDADGDAALRDARRYVEAGCDAIRITTPGSDRLSTLAMLDVAERVRLDTGALAIGSCPHERAEDAAAGIASGRIDLVWFTGNGEPPNWAPGEP